jgi:hypothetical protein
MLEPISYYLSSILDPNHGYITSRSHPTPPCLHLEHIRKTATDTLPWVVVWDPDMNTQEPKPKQDRKV